MLLALSCSGTPEGNISIVTGEETDVFTRAPAAVTLVTAKVAVAGGASMIGRESRRLTLTNSVTLASSMWFEENNRDHAKILT